MRAAIAIVLCLLLSAAIPAVSQNPVTGAPLPPLPYVLLIPIPGLDAGARINGAMTILTAIGGGTVFLESGTYAVTTNITVGGASSPVQLILAPNATITLAAAGLVLANGAQITGAGTCRDAGKCSTIQRLSGTTTMIAATGAAGNHVRGFGLRGFFLDGGATAGHGIVLDYVDTFTIEDIEPSNGGASNALRILNEAWDFSVLNSHLVIWGDASNYTVHLAGLNGGSQIVDGHWIGNQIGETATGAPLLFANAFVLHQRFVDNKFHHSGGTMTHLVDWSGSRSDFIGSTFQADTASAAGGMLRIKNGDNRVIGGQFNDVATGDAIHFSGAGGGAVIGVTFRGTASPSPGSAVVAEASTTGSILVSSNEIINLTKGYDFSTGTGVRSIGPSTFTGVTTPVDATGVGATWNDFDAGKGTATFGGANLAAARSAATLNPVLRLGGNTATNSSGYQGAYLQSLFAGGGQINELLGMGTNWLAGLGAVSGTTIEHPVLWGFDSDASDRLISFYAKPAATPLTSSHEKAWITPGGRVVGAAVGTATNCADSAGAAACGSAAAGAFVIDAAATATVVSTTAVTANSQIFIFEDSSLNTRLGITCNTGISRIYMVTARTAAASFTVTASVAPVTNPACLNYFIVN